MAMDWGFDLLVAARWIYFVAISLVFGGSLFFVYADKDGIRGVALQLPRTARVMRIVITRSAMVVAASGLAWMLLSMTMIAGDLESALDRQFAGTFFLATPFGLVDLARLPLFVLLVFAGSLRAGKVFVPATLLVSACLMASQAWLGHAAEGGATPIGWLMVISYVAHVTAGAAWLGGLLPLFLAMREIRTDPARSHRTERQVALLLRFSAMGYVAVALVIVSGVANVFFHSGFHWSALRASPWGACLLAKTMLVLLALALALLNRLAAGARRERASTDALRLERPVSISIGLEIATAIGILGSAALLGVTPPPG